MTNIPAGQRLWHCPDCNSEVLLPVTRLDPLACDACLAKLKGGAAASPVASVVGTVSAVPANTILLVAIGAGMLVVGLVVGFVAGRISVPPPAIVRPTRPDDEDAGAKPAHPAEPVAETEPDSPDESTRPGPGYKWVRGYARKDGVKVKGHWAKDANYVDPEKKRKK